MVKRDDQMFSQGWEIGQANQRLLPRVKRWCRHIDVKMTSYGALAQATGLPIGHLKVICPHGNTFSESAHLSWEASEFILRNCVGCTHHEEISPDNYGREVLAEGIPVSEGIPGEFRCRSIFSRGGRPRRRGSRTMPRRWEMTSTQSSAP